jgi:hypothetical protein
VLGDVSQALEASFGFGERTDVGAHERGDKAMA